MTDFPHEASPILKKFMLDFQKVIIGIRVFWDTGYFTQYYN